MRTEEQKAKAREYAREYRKKHSERLRLEARERYANNREACLSNKKRYYAKNREEIRATQAEYQKANYEQMLENNKQWRKKNPLKAKMKDVLNRYNRYNAIPNWLTKEDKQKIKDIYKKCKELTMQTGIQHHVDHIIPIKGKNISGLHVPENLQILTASQNCSKRNSFEAGTLTIQEAD